MRMLRSRSQFLSNWHKFTILASDPAIPTIAPYDGNPYIFAVRREAEKIERS